MEYDLVNRPHPHPLLFNAEGRFNGVFVVLCSRCRLPLHTASFSCFDSNCNFNIHESCLHFPDRIHSLFFHPQHRPLVLGLHSTPGGQWLYEEKAYRCTACRFVMDLKCAMADTQSSGLWLTSNWKYVHMGHPHPLTFIPEATLQQNKGGIVFCVVCELRIESGSSIYFCSQCDDAHFHKQCAELPLQLRIPDHPHPLSLQNISKIRGIHCDSCRNYCGWFIYTCFECSFNLHTACLQSLNHKHTLTRLRTKIEFTCGVCGEISKDRFLWFCDICHILIHKECVEFPLTLRIPDHNHDLTFQYFWSDMVKYHCKTCGQEIHNKKEHRDEYGCFKCRPIFIDMGEIRCNDCRRKIKFKDADARNCPICMDISLDQMVDIRCNICGVKINIEYAGYGCSQCNYFTHLNCAQFTTMVADSTENEKLAAVAGAGAGGKEIDQRRHFGHLHDHHLTLFPPEKIRELELLEYRVCDGCMKCLSVSRPSYGCAHCDFFLHEECAKLPTTITQPRLHPHSLTLISIPNFVFQCKACLQHFHGFAYHCQTCFSTFDVRCTSIQISFQHPNHQHLLYMFKAEQPNFHGYEEKTYCCEACGKDIDYDTLGFRCTDTNCKIYLDLRCATLPVIVRYRFDPHPLNLTFVEEEKRDEYFCDICEKERELGLWFYSCGKCSFAAHPRCALGEFPYVKSMMHKSHQHPLSLVMERNEEEGHGVCGDCNKSCAQNLALECGSCNFNVHATGRCFDSQMLKGNLAFTNHNVFSRANQPYDDYDHLIQNLPKIKTLGPFGSKKGSGLWKEGVFSTIRAFVVYYGNGGINCIQIQYAKNGELVWSKHGKEEGIKTEVYFNYPDEYLVSIHGYHSKSNSCGSLKLQTNRKAYGSFDHIYKGEDFFIYKDGNKDDYMFSSEGVKIIGIFGTYDSDPDTGFISSIGFHGVSTQE